jgi:hypothetical protein
MPNPPLPARRLFAHAPYPFPNSLPIPLHTTEPGKGDAGKSTLSNYQVTSIQHATATTPAPHR